MVYGNIPSHIKAPEGIVLKPSKVDRRLIGAWCTSVVKQGSLFGPFKGEIVKENERKKIDFRYAWEVYDLETSELIHIINATDPSKGDWTRYVNCARYLEEQNLVSVQEGTQVFYKAIRDIPAGEELLTWFEKRKIRENSNVEKKEKPSKIKGTPSPKKKTVKRSKSDSSLGLGENVTIGEKRQRKKKKMFGDVEEVSLAELIPKKRSKRSMDSKESSTEDPTTEAITTQIFNSLDVDTIKVYSTTNNGSEFLEADKRKMKEIEDSWRYPPKRREYQFGFLNRIATSVNNRRMYKCNICGGLYRHKFSLKRHYLRNHINCQYLSKAAITNCMISVASQYHTIVKENGEEAINKIHNHIHIKMEEAGISLDEKFDEAANDTNEEELSDTTSNDEENIDELAADINPDEKYTESGLYPGLYRCNACSKLFDKAPELTDHTKEHSEIPDAKTFACSLCNMTFKFKMNLVRHQLVHEGKMFASNSMGTSKQKVKVKPVNDSGDPKRPYMCSQCPMKFKYSTNLVKHEIVHSGDRPCKCSVCNKSFPSTTNLKKHMNIHIGCKVPCRHCEAVFSHVGALRKHIRLLHPTVHRERLLKLLEKQGKLGVKAQKYLESSYENENSNGKSSERGSTCSSSNEGEKETRPKKEKRTKTRIEDGIDSRFKFSCTICKKRFTEYVNMCRHRYVAHEGPEEEGSSIANSDGSSDLVNVVEENPEAIAAFFANVAYNIAENLTCYLDGGQEALEAHSKREDEDVDVESMEEVKKVEGSPNIALDQYNFPLSYNARMLQENFEYCPLDPSELMKKYEKEVPKYFDVNIDENSLDERGPALCTRRRSSRDSKDDSRDSIWGNRFDGNMTNSPVKSERSESPMLKIASVFSGKEAVLLMPETPKKYPPAEKASQNNETITIAPLEGKTDEPSQKSENHSDEEKMKEDVVNSCKDSIIAKEDDGIETDTKVASEKSQDTEDPKNAEDEENIAVDDITNDVKESLYAETTPVKSLKDSGESNASRGDINGNRKHKQECSSETEVEKRYNSDNVDRSTESKDNQLNNESEHFPRKHVFKIMEYSKMKKGGLTVICHSDLQRVQKNVTVKDSDKSDSLTNIVNEDDKLHDPEVSANISDSTAGSQIKSGLDDKPQMDDICSDDSNSGILLVDLFTDSDSEQTNKDHDMMLQGLDLARGTNTMTDEKKTRSFSVGNSPQLSPLYNYETIMFGKLGDTAYVCSVCKRHYPDFDRLIRHQWKKHPSIYCDFMEVEQGYEIESLYYSKPCNRGLLGSSGKALERAMNRPSYTCTRCRGSFKSVDRLRVHIINCATPQPSPKKKKSYYKRKTPIKVDNAEIESPSLLVSQVNVKELNVRMTDLSSKNDKKEDNMASEKPVNSEENEQEKSLDKISVRPRPTTPEQKTVEKRATIDTKVTPKRREITEVKEKTFLETKSNEQKTHKASCSQLNVKKKNMIENKMQVKEKSTHTLMFKSKATGKSMSPLKIQTDQSKAGKSMVATENIQKNKGRRGRDFVIYNPRNHIRRRELSEVLDKQQCKGCGVKFKTISLLERHVKKCDEKDKFKDIELIKSNVNEAFHQKQRHMCFYCNKGFIYPKSLMNHFKAFCLVKKERMSNGLSDEDTSTEANMMKRLIQQEEDRKITTEEFTERKKGGWPRGKKRKHRRKNHSWTIIKQRKSSSNGVEVGATGDGICSVEENEELEASKMEDTPSVQASDSNMKPKSEESKEQHKKSTNSPLKSGDKKECVVSSVNKGSYAFTAECKSKKVRVLTGPESANKFKKTKVTPSGLKGMKESESSTKVDSSELLERKISMTSLTEKEKNGKSGTELSGKGGRRKIIKNDFENSQKNITSHEEVKGKKVKVDVQTALNIKLCKQAKTKKGKSYGTTKNTPIMEGKMKKVKVEHEQLLIEDTTRNMEGRAKKGKISFDNPDMKFMTMKNIVKKGGSGGSPVRTVEKEIEEDSEKVTSSKLTFHIYDSDSFKKKKATTTIGAGVERFHIIQLRDFVGKSSLEGDSHKVGGKGRKSGEGEKGTLGGSELVVEGGLEKDVMREKGCQTLGEMRESGNEGSEKKSTGSNKIKGVVNKKPDTLQFHQVDVAAIRTKKGNKAPKRK